MKRWAGLGVIADNLHHLGTVLADRKNRFFEVTRNHISSASDRDRPAMLLDFGPYHTIGVLGEGGMGIVYLAEQREPVRRRVALKALLLRNQHILPPAGDLDSSRVAAPWPPRPLSFELKTAICLPFGLHWNCSRVHLAAACHSSFEFSPFAS
jgi:hypothetical protein